MIKSSNPVLSGNLFRTAAVSQQAMTLRGAVEKTGILFLCLLISAGFTWFQFLKTGNVQAVTPWMMVGIFGGLIAGFVTVFKQQWAPITAPIYAILEGLFIGGISSMLEVQFPGIVIQAAGATFAVMAVMLFLYESQWIEVTQKFRLGVVAATGGIALFYFVAIIFSFFGMPFSILWSNGPFGILFSLFVVGIASLNLVLDFDMIDQGAKAGAPKFMEWYCAFALMVTLVWLYMEILRLLAKLRSNR